MGVPTIAADRRERISGILAQLVALGAAVEERRLAVGDYDLGRGILVERKTVRDLHLTLVEGRFWRQVGQLRRAAKWPMLLVEGQRLSAGPVAADAIRGVCLATVEQGIVLLRSEGALDTAAWLFRLALRAQTVRRRDRPPFAQIPKSSTRRSPAEAVLCAVPGVSIVSARALLRSFGTIAALAVAEPSELAAVPGIGPRRREALLEALRGEQPPLRPSSPRDEGPAPST